MTVRCSSGQKRLPRNGRLAALDALIVDVGAIKEIYDVILHLAAAGAAVIVISSSPKRACRCRSE
jgi:hypothetical protein